MMKTPTNRTFRDTRKHGQVTIFFSVSMVVIITLIAFVINVGLYVKAKINLQNATDAAAWSGAAVQARQLTTIGYLNWEMRNIYKEWMFKYYILGSMSYDGVINPQGGPMKFTMKSRPVPGAGTDIYNFPSTCIHFAGTTDICKRYEIPGLPRFENTNLPGVDQTMNTFIDSIVTKKSEDCSKRTELNFLTLTSWIYGIPDNQSAGISQLAPAIASERPGAWPKALELAIRIRNLEYAMNTHGVGGKDFNRGVCSGQSNSQGLSCATTIGEIMSQGLPHYERTVKAFFAGYRNLGNEEDDEMKGSFTLTELTPMPAMEANEYALSNLLIPAGKWQKHYVDLKLIPLNFINFYTAFITKDDGDLAQQGITGAEIGEGACGATKVGIPVPGYPFGFVKSPDVLTYYAVRGEANFIGLFNPFQTTYTKLTAYSAAKPFGARIGPHLFDANTDPAIVKGRTLPPKTAAYFNGLALADSSFKPGEPIPQSSSFWVSDPDHAIGGWMAQGEIRFGLPNMIYENHGDMSKHQGTQAIMVFQPQNAASAPEIGLFDSNQFSLFKANFPEFNGNTPVNASHIHNAILNVRAPTLYEAQNYLVPFPQELQASGFGSDSHGFIDVPSSGGIWDINIFAPIYHSSGAFLYAQQSELRNMLTTYIKNQKPAMDSYRLSLKIVANNIRSQQSGQGLYFNAAKIINDDFNGAPLTCYSITGKLYYYFLGDDFSGMSNVQGCPEPFSESLLNSWYTNQNGFSDFYQMRFKYRPNESNHNRYYSAYSPGPFHGASQGAVVTNKILGNTETMLRNFYSTKFVTLKSLSQGGVYTEGTSSFPIVSEGVPAVQNDTKQSIFKNPINTGGINIDLQDIDY